MMTSQKEKQLSSEMRLIARQYCDGAFNKIEYRRRRRDILLQCVDVDLSQPANEAEIGEASEHQPVTKVTIASSTNWLPYLMVVVTLTVLGVMGFLLFTLL